MDSAGKRKRLKRKPLVDCTNTVSSVRRAAKLLSKPSKLSPSAKSQECSQKYEASTGSNAVLNPCNTLILNDFQFKPVKFSDDVRGKGPEITTGVNRHTQEQRKDKGKDVMDSFPSSCPPIGRTKNFRANSGREDKVMNNSEDGLPKEHHLSPPKRKKKRRYSVAEYILPQDFIDKQRAYFAEIDAFELAEEEFLYSYLYCLERKTGALPFSRQPNPNVYSSHLTANVNVRCSNNL
ncbi:uncharacterized protein [Aristolochia californica]|uniref:uncharacterized protein n=1 Tax=Aristolochia californica TaxID=171875 RepID=UPI0035DEE199